MALWELPEDSIITKSLGERLSRQGNNSIEIYFEADDINLYYNRLKHLQTDFLHEIHEEPWGQRAFRFFDPDNNLLEIGERMDHVVLRLYNSGMTVAQIINKTGMDKDRILAVI